MPSIDDFRFELPVDTITVAMIVEIVRVNGRQQDPMAVVYAIAGELNGAEVWVDTSPSMVPPGKYQVAAVYTHAIA